MEIFKSRSKRLAHLKPNPQKAAPRPPARALAFESPESSNIARAVYTPLPGGNGDILLTFHHGRSYCYFSVPDAVWDDFVKADSKGSYFSLHIKDAYSCQKL